MMPLLRVLARQVLVARIQHNLLVGRLAALWEHPLRPACYTSCVVEDGEGNSRLLMSVEQVQYVSDGELDEFIDSMVWRG